MWQIGHSLSGDDARTSGCIGHTYASAASPTAASSRSATTKPTTAAAAATVRSPRRTTTIGAEEDLRMCDPHLQRARDDFGPESTLLSVRRFSESWRFAR